MKNFGVVARLVLPAIGFLLLVAPQASASCTTDGQGPCYRFWNVDAVFVAKVLVKEALIADGDQSFLPYEFRLQVVVVEAFRGVAIGERITLFAPDGVCGGVSATDGGELFVYASRNKKGELWALGCGVSKPLIAATADLEYARSVTATTPEARVYGDVVQQEDRYGDARDFTELEGVRVRVVGASFVAEMLTDKNGRYSLTLPGAGAYTIATVPPDGLADRMYGPNGAKFEIRDPRECASIPFQLRSNGRVRGQVVDVDGSPVADLFLSARGFRGMGYEYFGKTDDSGMFDIGPLTEGAYEISTVTEHKFATVPRVQIPAGGTVTLAPLVVDVTIGSTRLAIDVIADGAGDVFIQVFSDGGAMYDPSPANGRIVRFLVNRNESIKIHASSATHEAEAVVRSSGEPETKVTLTLRPHRQ